MSLVNWGREKMDTGNFDSREYRAIVIDNNDPLMAHRLKVRILDIHREVKDEHLPWAMPDSNTGVGNTGVTGTVNILPIGSFVRVTFASDDPYHLSYSGDVYSQANRLEEITGTPDNPQNDYPHTRGGIDASGNLWKVNSKRDTFEFTHVSGTSIMVYGNGSVKIVIGKDAVGPDAQSAEFNGCQIEIQGEHTIKATEKLTIEAHDGAELHTTQLDLFATQKLNIKATQDMMITSATKIDIIAPDVNIVEMAGSPAPALSTPPTAPETRSRPEIKLPDYLQDEVNTEDGPVGIIDIIGGEE